MNNFTKEYKNLLNNYLYYDREKVKRIYLIFEGKGGSQTITRDIIPDQTKIRDFLILNSEMERALKYINNQLIDLHNKNQQISSYLFYFSQYGGSKTQFLNLVQDEIERRNPRVIIVFIDDLTQLKPSYIFEQLLSQLMTKIGTIKEFNKSDNYEPFFQKIYSHISEINVAMRQSTNLKKAEDLIESLETSNLKRKQNLQELDDLLHSTILVDNVEILKRIKQLLQTCTENNLIFLFLFDEVDLWLDEYSSQLQFSNKFSNITKFMKNFLEFPDQNIKLFFLFACTDRVNKLFQEQQAVFSSRSPTASRLIRIYQNAEKIPESGTYGDSIDEAFLKLSVLHQIANKDSVKVDEEFYNRTIDPLKRKYNDIPRRNTNSIIIRLLKSYQTLYYSLQNGLRNWKNSTEKYGNLIQRHLTSILKRLNVKFIRRDILIDPSKELTLNKIDGYFINYDYKGLEKRIHTEIKVTKGFKGDKSRQVLQWLQIHPEKPFIFLIFSPTPKEDIKEEINLYSEKLEYSLDLLKNLYIIHIDNPYSFCAIDGITKVIGESQELANFLDDFSFWFDFFGDFTDRYQEVLQDVGFLGLPPKEEKKVEEESEERKEKEEKGEKIKLSKEENNVIQILIHMFRENKFTSSGMKFKSSIEKIIEKKSMGITNTERLYKTMRDASIIKKINPSSVNFSIKEGDEILNLSLEQFVEEIRKKFASKPKKILLNY